MAHYSLRAGALILVASLVMLVFAILIGQQVETSTVTEYIKLEYHVYPILIRDAGSTTVLQLAGKRCFDAPSLDPEWIAVRQQYQTNYMEHFQVRDLHPEDPVA